MHKNIVEVVKWQFSLSNQYKHDEASDKHKLIFIETTKYIGVCM